MDDLEAKKAEISEELSGLEKELRQSGRRFYVNMLRSYNRFQGSGNYFFTIAIDDSYVGTIFPFRKIAFCGRALHSDGDYDPVFVVIKKSLEKRGYSVKYNLSSPYALLRKLNP